ncbi:TM1266 family iron-only hydrogenase system putative regulator [Alkaliphilus crotonatoxidans]
MVEKRIGVVAIIVEDRRNAENVNRILSEYGEIIVGRMGVPYRERGVSVLSVIIDGSTDEVGGLTGKLGRLQGVTVKSALTKK